MSVILRPRSQRSLQPPFLGPAQSFRGPFAFLAGAIAVLALVLATAFPARADDRDLTKALIAALIIGALAQELTDQPGSVYKPARKPRLPSVCAISIDGEGQALVLYSGNCLRDEGYSYSLPRECSSRATIFGDRDRVYSAKCLRKAGFKVTGY